MMTSAVSVVWFCMTQAALGGATGAIIAWEVHTRRRLKRKDKIVFVRKIGSLN